jgi:hypothetical protein
MFKVAPRYLSGVSVFLGDDITRRDTDGELAIFIGPAIKGPLDVVTLANPDVAIGLYGTNSPITKALFEFWDGYTDAGRTIPLKFVAKRIGGIPFHVKTTNGIDITSKDAYTGLGNDYTICVNDSLVTQTRGVKIWDKNKQKVYDSLRGIDGGYFTVTATLAGTGTITGIDLDSDPLATTLTTLTAYSQSAFGLSVTASDSECAVGSTPSSADYRAYYKYFRNALADLEQYTPDYIIPAGVAYNETYSYTGNTTRATTLVSDTTSASILNVDAADDWPAAGTVSIMTTAGNDVHSYTSKTVYQVADYQLTVKKPVFTTPISASGITQLTLTASGGFTQADIKAEGYLSVSGYTIKYKAVDATGNVVNIVSPLNSSVGVPFSYYMASGAPFTSGAAVVATKVIGGAFIGTTVSTTFTGTQPFQLGLGYIKEYDMGDHIEFSAWSDVKLPGYYLAHFGYMFANFCNQATIGYNTPLCGMNADIDTVTAAGFTRSGIVNWIGKAPTPVYVAGLDNTILSLASDGTGLLGEPSLSGSTAFNRCGMSDPINGSYSDPAWGLLMTDQGFIDGDVIYDTYNNTVDLGKFLLVGAGLLTFTNRASGKSYIDACGIYALGMLAGKPKNEGISFSKIGVNSNVTVSVIVNRKWYSDLAAKGYIVVTREHGLGWVINNGNSVARDQSAYYLISTTRIIKTVIEGKRALLAGFIGKAVNRYYYEAAKTKLAESFGLDVNKGLLNGYTFDLQIIESQKAIGKFFLKTSLNPPEELTQVDIEAVIDRNVTAGA